MQSGSMKALLAVLAVAGYQNRDKIAEILRGVSNREQQPGTQTANGAPSGQAAGASPGLNDILDKLRGGGLGSVLSGGSIGSILSGGLGDLLDGFKQSGQSGKADSWVRTGPNEPIADTELADALGPDVLRDLAARTGMSEQEILRRLAKDLPDAIDGLTPDGKVPSPSDPI